MDGFWYVAEREVVTGGVRVDLYAMRATVRPTVALRMTQHGRCVRSGIM